MALLVYGLQRGPSDTALNSLYLAFANFKHFGNVAQRSAGLPYSFDFNFSKLAPRVEQSFSLRSFASPFTHHIRTIFCKSPQKEMFWINALSVVAAMTYAQTLWNYTIGANPREAMGGKVFPLLSWPKLPVAATV